MVWECRKKKWRENVQYKRNDKVERGIGLKKYREKVELENRYRKNIEKYIKSES